MAIQALEGDPSFETVGLDRITRLAKSLEFTGARSDLVAKDFSRFLGEAGGEGVGRTPRYVSGVANDGMPIEFSIAWSHTDVELRYLVEPLPVDFGKATRQALAVDLIAALLGTPGASVARFQAIQDIYLSHDPSDHFSIWLSGAYRRHGDPLYKVYLNPSASGSAPEAVRETMRRFAVEASWDAAERCLDSLPYSTEIAFVSLDLTTSSSARFKVYVRHVGATAPELEVFGSSIGAEGLVAHYYDGLLRYANDQAKSPITCFSFRQSAEGFGTTLYCPLAPNIPNDREAAESVTAFLESQGLPSGAYASALQSLSDRPLDETAIQSWIGFKWNPAPVVAAYFGPEVYGSGPIGL